MSRPMSTYELQAHSAHSTPRSPHLTARPRTQLTFRPEESEGPRYVPLRRLPSGRAKAIGIQTEEALRIPSALGLERSVQAGYDLNNYYPVDYSGGAPDDPSPRPWYPNQLRPKTPSVSFNSPPVLRQGRVGSGWRHIRQCTGNLGNNIMFVEGTVKEEDCMRYPPHGYPLMSYKTSPWSQHRKPALSVTQRPVGHGPSRFHSHAKNNFKYWYDEKRPLALIPTSIQGRIMKSGAAY